MKNIAILGAGWLGKSLALHLQDQNLQVKVSVSSIEKKERLVQEGLHAFVFKLTENLVYDPDNFLENVEVLVVSLPPVGIGFFETLRRNINCFGIKKVILFSSTGIYTDCEGTVTEETALQVHLPKVMHLKTIEDLFVHEPYFNTVVLRLGGLVGSDRHPVFHLAKKQQIADGNEPVNLVTKEEILPIVVHFLKSAFSTNVFNLVSNEHGTKEVYYTNAAQKLGIKLPPFVNAQSPKNRIVSAQKLTNYLNKTS